MMSFRMSGHKERGTSHAVLKIIVVGLLVIGKTGGADYSYVFTDLVGGRRVR